MKQPVLITTFNRPDCLHIVLKKVLEYGPTSIYIAIDTANKNDEKNLNANREVIKLCEEAKEIDPSIKLLIHDDNLGCRDAMQTAISWFFINEARGIILEDDCIPAPEFFVYTSALLEKYDSDETLMHISGSNFQLGKEYGNSSYYASKMPHIWGWATWRRAWSKYEKYIDPEEFSTIADYLGDSDLFEYHKRCFIKTNSGEINTWDYQWFYSIWKNRGICLTPNSNLVTNIGFRNDATHTLNTKSSLAELPIKKLKIPLTHPKTLTFQPEADYFYYRKHLNPKITLLDKVIFKLRLIIKNIQEGKRPL